MTARPTILIATKNAGKLREIREITEGLSVRLVSLDDCAGLPEPVENAATFQDKESGSLRPSQAMEKGSTFRLTAPAGMRS